MVQKCFDPDCSGFQSLPIDIPLKHFAPKQRDFDNSLTLIDDEELLKCYDAFTRRQIQEETDDILLQNIHLFP